MASPRKGLSPENAPRVMRGLSGLLVAWMLVIAGPAPVVVAADAKPNFVILMLDDASPSFFGWQGDEVGNTARFDRLVDEGLTFTFMHTMSRCRPSGTRFLVGAPAIDEVHNGIWTNLSPNEIITDRIWPKLLAEAPEQPYRVFGSGKIEYIPWRLGLDGYKDETFWTKPGDDDTAPIISFLEQTETESPGDPWAVYLRIRMPHEPLIAPPPFVDIVESKRHLIRIPARVPVEDHEEFLDDEVQRRAMMGWADNRLNRLVQTLAANGHVDDYFLIVVFTDNGRTNGEVAKGSPYCAGVNTAMTVWHGDSAWLPDHLRGTRVDDIAADVLDLSATILDYGGVTPPQSYVGHSLRGIIDGTLPTRRWRHRHRQVTPGATFSLAVTDEDNPSPVEDLIAVYATSVEMTPQGMQRFRWVQWMRDIPDAETAFDIGLRHTFLPFEVWGPKRKFDTELILLEDPRRPGFERRTAPRPADEMLRRVDAKMSASVYSWWERYGSETLPRP